ncbi:FAD/NAD(P)-binding domain-containing protein [Xylariaceae sp. FL0255]|nr:FAD/NAD(P)-binding domain-containing protein [Xylariaceae sp. FL0255]
MMPIPEPGKIQENIERDESSKLNVIIVGAGLGGLGAAIAILLAGHDVTVLESASEIGEIGAGIQVLPNAAHVLTSWGMKETLDKLATRPSKCNFWGWQGNFLSEMDYYGYTRVTGAPFWDFHRSNLHKSLMDRAVELGAEIISNARVDNFTIADDGILASVYLSDGRVMTADLVVGADGIHSKMREVFLGKEDPPTATGDLAYRLLIDTKHMMDDPELRAFVDEPQVNYWIGPDVHAVNYILRGGKLLNLVLLVPDNMPIGSGSIIEGDAAEMRAHFARWDPRLSKLAALSTADSVLKWRLCIRPGLDPTWSHPSGAFTMLGDAVHATLPYLASGAGMALEDGGVLGLCLGRLTDKSPASKRKALQVYEACRRERTEKVVQRGSYNQWIYHLHDGPEQQERDEKFRHYEKVDREWLSQDSPIIPRVQETGDDPFPWRYHGVGRWLFNYDMWQDVEEHWPVSDSSSEPAAHTDSEPVQSSL